MQGKLIKIALTPFFCFVLPLGWLRSANSNNNNNFFRVESSGDWNNNNSNNTNGVAPDFCIQCRTGKI